MRTMQGMRLLSGVLAAAVALIVGTTVPRVWAAEFEEARIYWGYNSTRNDLGVHVTPDAEDWKTLKIAHLNGGAIFEVATRGAYAKFGLTEMFFEGAKPSLEDVPLKDLLALFPEGKYTFIGTTIEGTTLQSTATLSHAIPAGPRVSTQFDDDHQIIISWTAVTAPPNGFPNKRIEIVGYQVTVGSFQVTLPASIRSVTLLEEFVRSLKPGSHPFEVLAIDKSGNQTITEGSFTKR